MSAAAASRRPPCHTPAAAGFSEVRVCSRASERTWKLQTAGNSWLLDSFTWVCPAAFLATLACAIRQHPGSAGVSHAMPCIAGHHTAPAGRVLMHHQGRQPLRRWCPSPGTGQKHPAAGTATSISCCWSLQFAASQQLHLLSRWCDCPSNQVDHKSLAGVLSAAHDSEEPLPLLDSRLLTRLLSSAWRVHECCWWSATDTQIHYGCTRKDRGRMLFVSAGIWCLNTSWRGCKCPDLGHDLQQARPC